jgi:hypothetical protein
LRAYDAQLKEMIAKPALPYGLVRVAKNATGKVAPIDQAKNRLDLLAPCKEPSQYSTSLRIVLKKNEKYSARRMRSDSEA